MKSKKEEKLPEEGCDTKMSAEKEATNDVANNETVKEEVGENDEAKLSLLEAWAPFLRKFIKVMIAIEDVIAAKKVMQEDPYFVQVMQKFMEFREKYEAEHPEFFDETEEVDDDYDCEDKELFDVVKKMRDKLQAHGISVKVRKVTDPEEVKRLDRLMKDVPQKNGTTPMAEA